MNKENRTNQYEVIVKNMTLIPQKSIISVESMRFSITGPNFLFLHCTLARNAEYTSDQSLGNFSRLNDPWFWD